MIKRIPANTRHLAAHGWLNSFHLFSFAEYYDPENVGFGPLRVFNDDFIIGESGFGEHPHKNMEIVTIMREGTLTHRDSMGNTKTITAGEVQCMTAGTGVAHAEVNMGKEPVRLSQIWIEPREKDLAPAYDQRDYSTIEKNTLVAVASGQGMVGALNINTDSTIYLGEFEAGSSITHVMEKGRGVFVYLTAGSLSINGETFETGDQARIDGETSLALVAVGMAKFVLIDVPLA
jgi:hypothetical protein